MSSFQVPPNQHRNLRACMAFTNNGCPNCDEFLELAGHTDNVSECTSQVFDGLITLADPTASWVAKWQRLDKYVPGTYAVKVTGILPEEIVQVVADAGVKYIPRDGSGVEDEAS